MPLLSLSSQWINLSFTLQKAVLQAKQFHGSHTGAAITTSSEEIVNAWKIEKSRVHVILRDNGSNMIKAMDRLELPVWNASRTHCSLLWMRGCCHSVMWVMRRLLAEKLWAISNTHHLHTYDWKTFRWSWTCHPNVCSETYGQGGTVRIT